MMGITKLSLLLVILAGSPALAQWLVGQYGTTGGNAAGAPCVFPFLYGGITYNECITKDAKWDQPWCAVTSNYDAQRLWAFCIVKIKATKTRRGTGGRQACAFPFTYNGATYDECVGVNHPYNAPGKIPWCSYSTSTATLWGECTRYPVIKTTAGANCVFPFLYRNRLFEGCITAWNNGQGWCSTTANYDQDRQWGNCVVTTLKSSGGQPAAECPNGDYDKTDNTLSYGGVGDSSADTVDKCKKVCNDKPRCLGFDWDGNSGLTERCFIHEDQGRWDQKTSASAVDQYRITKRCTSDTPAPGGPPGAPETETGKPVTTRGGNADPGSRCSFPYVYGGDEYTTCNSKGWYTPWCATTGNYEGDRQWGECDNIPTE